MHGHIEGIEMRHRSGTMYEPFSQETLRGNFEIVVADQRQKEQNHKEQCHDPTGIVHGVVDAELSGQDNDQELKWEVEEIGRIRNVPKEREVLSYRSYTMFD